MSKLASRIEKLERRTPGRKVPRDDAALVEWALDSLFPSKRLASEGVREHTPVEGEPSPFLVFLKLVRSGEIQRELERRGLRPPAERGWLADASDTVRTERSDEREKVTDD
jgi:hypothetical protein